LILFRPILNLKPVFYNEYVLYRESTAFDKCNYFRKLELVGFDQEIVYMFIVKAIEMEYFIITNHKHAYLMRLDLPNLKCVFVEQIQTDIHRDTIVFDFKNRRRFCICDTDNNYNCWLTCCQLKDSRISYDPTFQTEKDLTECHCKRLDGNCVQFFTPNYTKFGEYTMTAGNQNCAFKKLFDFNGKDIFYSGTVSYCVNA
jgi:hypothetical protein